MRKKVKVSTLRQRKNITFIIGIFILIIIIFSFIQYRKTTEDTLQQLSKLHEIQITYAPTPLRKISAPPPTPVPIVWKTYVDNEYGFQLKYPESYLIPTFLDENSKDLITIKNVNGGRTVTFHISYNLTAGWFEISVIPINDGAKELLIKQASILALKEGESIAINERKIGNPSDKYFLVHDSNIRLPSKMIHGVQWDGYEFHNGWENYSTDYTYFTQHNNFIYIIHNIVESDMSICDQIMETVNFLK
jgi:hypothetical protein